jgi:hypothetical protein
LGAPKRAAALLPIWPPTQFGHNLIIFGKGHATIGETNPKDLWVAQRSSRPKLAVYQRFLFFVTSG